MTQHCTSVCPAAWLESMCAPAAGFTRQPAQQEVRTCTMTMPSPLVPHCAQ